MYQIVNDRADSRELARNKKNYHIQVPPKIFVRGKERANAFSIGKLNDLQTGLIYRVDKIQNNWTLIRGNEIDSDPRNWLFDLL